MDAVYGPLKERASVVLMVAFQLDAEFHYAERFAHAESEGLGVDPAGNYSSSCSSRSA